LEASSEIEALVAFEGRWAGTEGERRAAEHLAARLRSLGREADVEPAEVRPDYPLTYVLHILLAFAGGAVSMRRPKLGAAALLAAIVSAFGDSNARFHLLRRLTNRVFTHNVLSREQEGKPGTLVLLAHYDAAKTGRLFDPKGLERRVRLGRRLGLEIGLFEPFTWSLLALLSLALLRAAGGPRRVLSAARMPPMLVLAAHIPLLLEIRASEPVPGAADNASGVATVLRLAERHGGRLRHHDLWVLFTGAEEGLLLGMREWVRRHKHELDPQRTVFLNVDEAGYGTVRYTTSDSGDAAPSHLPSLSELCHEVRDEERAGRFGAEPMPQLGLAEGAVAAHSGFRAIRIACLPEPTFAPEYHRPTDTPDRLDPEAPERAFEFCSRLIEKIDDRLIPQSNQDRRRNGQKTPSTGAVEIGERFQR
jgi:Peptidase family M28